MCLKPENDHKGSLIKGLDVVRQCAALLERRVQSSTRVRKAQAVTRQTNPIGRSMIEMLGVLAIIGVLSVGGIQGFSKAMKMYHWNKALREWDILINVMVKYKSELHINNDLSLIPILSATGDLPDDMPITDNGLYLTDALGNKLRIYSHGSGYVGIGYFVEKNDIEACKMFLTMGQYHHNLIQYIQFYNIDKEDGKYKVFAGDSYCREDRPCLRDLSISQIHELCKNNNVCKDTKSCRYLVYWY